MCGSVTNVHKPLIGASEVARKHDAFIWQDGGALVPKDSPVARGMRDAWWRLMEWHGDHMILPLHREGNLYNFYLKKVSPAELSPADEPQKPQNCTRKGNIEQSEAAQEKCNRDAHQTVDAV